MCIYIYRYWLINWLIDWLFRLFTYVFVSWYLDIDISRAYVDLVWTNIVDAWYVKQYLSCIYTYINCGDTSHIYMFDMDLFHMCMYIYICNVGMGLNIEVSWIMNG